MSPLNKVENVSITGNEPTPINQNQPLPSNNITNNQQPISQFNNPNGQVYQPIQSMSASQQYYSMQYSIQYFPQTMPMGMPMGMPVGIPVNPVQLQQPVQTVQPVTPVQMQQPTTQTVQVVAPAQIQQQPVQTTAAVSPAQQYIPTQSNKIGRIIIIYIFFFKLTFFF